MLKMINNKKKHGHKELKKNIMIWCNVHTLGDHIFGRCYLVPSKCLLITPLCAAGAYV